MNRFYPDSLLPNHEEALGKGSPGAGSPLCQQVLGLSPGHTSIHTGWPVLLTHTTQAQVTFPSRAPPGLSFPAGPFPPAAAGPLRTLLWASGSSAQGMVGSEGQSDGLRGPSPSATHPGWDLGPFWR